MNFIFDFDGTLANSLDAMISVFNENIRAGKNPLTPEEVTTLRGMTSRRVVRALGVRWWQIPKLIMQGLPDFRALVPSLKTFDGLPETLKQLKNRGDNLYIVTSNTKDSVEEFLKLHNMNEFFDDAYCFASPFKKAKPIRKLIKKHQLKRKETVYIGDETRDIHAARRARVRIVSVTWGFNTRTILEHHNPNFLVDKPEELLKIS